MLMDHIGTLDKHKYFQTHTATELKVIIYIHKIITHTLTKIKESILM